MLDDAKSRKAACLSTLRDAILTLRITPGSDLDETQLCARFGLSRTPLREVLQQLAGDGYVELRANRGARVSDLSYTTLREFFLVAPMLYGAVLRLAAQAATPAQIDALKAAQAEFRQAIEAGSGADRALANNRFHEITGAMARNPYLLPSFRRLLIDHARISMTFYRPGDASMTDKQALAVQHHDQIIAAIEARDDAAAARLAEDHWNLSRDQIQTFVIPAALDLPLGGAHAMKGP
tara:strand:+ start:1126 stop:1836 length:711 start_codon:yes stop_codon:yes gene_type:complete